MPLRFYKYKTKSHKKANPDRTTKPTGILDKHLQYVANKAQTRKNISRPIQPRSNAHSNGALNHTQPMQQLPNNSAQTVTVIWTIVLTLFVVVFVLKASCECTCTLHI